MDQQIVAEMGDHPDTHAAAGLAALSICESLLLALVDRKIMSPKDARGIFTDVIDAHRNAADLTTGADADLHRRVVAQVRGIMAGGNSEYSNTE